MKTITVSRSVCLVVVSMLLTGVFIVTAQSQPGKKRQIPLIRVTPRTSVADLPRLPGPSSKRRITGDARLLVPPKAYNSGEKAKLLRDSGITVTNVSAPDEFRLSPRQPFISSSAYLYFSGEVEFNAAGDSLLLHVDYTPPIPGPRINLLGDWNWASGGPQPDPPGVVGVLVRMEAHRTYVADFSVSSEAATNYQLTITGASGSGNFPTEGGGQHVLVAFHAHEPGYVRINFSANSSFTFHNVAVTKH
jgi:hypothetical protein